MTIKKIKYEITVLYDSKIDEGLAELSLEDVLRNDTSISYVEHVSTEDVPADKVEAELIAIENDGTFFDEG